jgi:hypothetical protein
MKEFKLAPSSLTYVMTLLFKLNSTNKTFTYFAKVALEVLGAKNNPTFV